MLIQVGDFEFTEVWDGVWYKKLADYPAVSDWEIRNIIEFMDYERMQGRECPIQCEDAALLAEIKAKIANRAKYLDALRPALITECTACPYRKGCETKLVCHTTSPENARSIFATGRLLSAVKARGIPGEQLMAESRNAANDPADYFDYVMLAWGNCQAGDRLVMERKLGRFPNEEDLSTGFTPGIRFYFRYDDLAQHPGCVFDGVLPMKIRDKILLEQYVLAIMIPAEIKTEVEALIPQGLQERVLYVANDCKDIWDWTEKIYTIATKLA